MIEGTTVQLASTGVYTVSAVVFLVLARRKPAELRRYCYPVVAGVSRRYLGALVGITVVMRAGYNIAELFDGTLALIILAGYATLVGLYVGPISTASARQPPARELFYTKIRNLVLFTFGVLITWAILQLFGLFAALTAAVTLEYLELLLRVGFAGFVLANVETLVTTDAANGGDGGDAPTHATPSPSAD